MPHVPWPEINNETLGEATIDFMEERYAALAAEYPMPPIQRYAARDGAKLALRVYKAENAKQDIVLIHGATVNSAFCHPLAVGLQKRGINVYVPDVRGHGESITTKPGSLEYMWQNLDDLEDLLSHYELEPKATAFVAHSAEGGSAWYLPSLEKWRERFAAFVAIAPNMGMNPELVKEPASSNFARAHVTRIIALKTLNIMGISVFNHQSVVRCFTRPTKSIEEYTGEYDYNMVISHGPMISLDYKAVLAKIPVKARIMSVSAGADEVFTDATPLLKPLFPSAHYVTIERATHMGILFDETLADMVADFVKGT